MSPAQWERAKDLFEAALRLDAAEQLQFVRRNCAGDETLYREVARLLARSDAADSFFHTPARNLDEGSATGAADGNPGESHLPGTPYSFSAGETACGRFIIRRFIGRGGMGEVYAAHDQLLNVTVALKTIRGDMGGKAAARFRKEVQLAREVTHRNACRIHDLFRHRVEGAQGAPALVVEFLSMEFLDGETLAQILDRGGALSPAVAMPIVRQIAEGLGAIHRARIVHRDLKPSNIILATSGGASPHAVITDFGLAKSEVVESTGLSGTETLAGTPAYMAPEQLEGRAATPASDIYSFGAICYEMLAGRNPHQAPTGMAMALKRVRERPQPLSESTPGIDARYERAIMKCLEPDPNARFATIEAFTAALDGMGPAIEGPGSKRRLWARPSFDRRQIAVGVAILLAIVALFVAWQRIKQQTAAIPAASLVLLTQLRSSDTELSGVTEVLRSQLAQSAQFALLDDEQVRTALQEMQKPQDGTMEAETAREVALRSGAAVVIFGNVEPLGQEYVLSIKVERLGGNPLFARNSWKQDFPASGRQDLFGAIHKAATWIRTTVGETESGLAEQDRPPEDTSTGSWKALRLYADALRANAQNKPQEALILLDEALQEDAHFAMAKMKRADILISLGRYGEGYRAWSEAKDAAEASQLTNREQLRISGQYYEDTGDWERAEQAYRAYALHYPNDFLAVFFVGSSLQDMARDEEAIPWFEKAAALRPQDTVPLNHLANVNIDLARFSEAQALAARVRAMGKQGWALWLESWLDFARGDVDSALRRAGGFQGLDPVWRSHGYSIRACWLGELGRLQEAAVQLKQGVAFDNEHGLRESQADKLVQLGWVYYRMHDNDRCADACQRSFDLEPSATRAMQAGSILARAGRLTAAREMLGRIKDQPDIPKVRLAQLQLAGEIRLAEGKDAEAVADFEEAAKLSMPRAPREFLARALGKSKRSNDALQAYQEILQHPARLYPDPERGLPGMWTCVLNDAVRVSRSLHAPDAGALQARFTAATAHADGDAFSSCTFEAVQH
jgi:serine/threonine protein kinase